MGRTGPFDVQWGVWGACPPGLEANEASKRPIMAESVRDAELAFGQYVRAEHVRMRNVRVRYVHTRTYAHENEVNGPFLLLFDKK